MEISLHLIVGVLAIAYGFYSYHQRKTRPESIAKLQESIERNGEKMANNIHLIGYTIMPIFCGFLFLLSHFRG